MAQASGGDPVTIHLDRDRPEIKRRRATGIKTALVEGQVRTGGVKGPRNLCIGAAEQRSQRLRRPQC